MDRVTVSPELLRWASERSKLEATELMERFPMLTKWEAGEVSPTLKQLEAFAHAVHVPIGYLFLPTPPDERLPIPDFRTVAGQGVKRPSPNLLDIIYVCQERQGWYREFAQVTRQPEIPFVGSATLRTRPEVVAETMRDALGFDLDARRESPTWTDALRLFIQQADQVGVLVMASSVVQNNNHRHLDYEEFRGFALVDRLAPLVFINGADTKAAQMFTLAHELAHLWLGASALSDATAAPVEGYRPEEMWCNRVAAELLAPLAVVQAELRADEALADTLQRLARRFKVSTLVILRRLLDAGHFDRGAFQAAWQQELDRLRALDRGVTGGGDFYRTTTARVGRRFARALVESTLEGQTLYRDAMRMLGIAKTSTFHELGRSVGVLT